MVKQVAPARVDRDALHTRFEATRPAFRQLVESLSDEDFKRATPNAGWDCDALLFHIGYSTEYLSQVAEVTRTGKGFNVTAFLPVAVLDRMGKFIMRSGGRKATRTALIEQFELAIEHMLASLSRIEDGQWTRTTRFRGQRRELAYFYSFAIEHIDEHCAEIRGAIRRGPTA